MAPTYPNGTSEVLTLYDYTEFDDQEQIKVQRGANAYVIYIAPLQRPIWERLPVLVEVNDRHKAVVIAEHTGKFDIRVSRYFAPLDNYPTTSGLLNGGFVSAHARSIEHEVEYWRSASYAVDEGEQPDEPHRCYPHPDARFSLYVCPRCKTKHFHRSSPPPRALCGFAIEPCQWVLLYGPDDPEWPHR